MSVNIDPRTIDDSSLVGFENEAVRRSGILKIKKVPGEIWDQYISKFDDAAQEQMFAFTKGRWPNVEVEPNLFFAQGQLVGGVMIMVQSLPLNIGKIAVAKWGPMLVDNGAEDAHLVYGRMIETLIGEYADKQGMMISILPKVSSSHINMAFEHLRARGFLPGAQLKFPDRYLVNLKLSDEEQRKSFAQKWRYHLNKSGKNSLTFERADASNLVEFDHLYKAMNERKKFADHSAYQTVSDLMAMDDEALRPELFFVRHEGEIIAGAIIYKTGDNAVYLYGATNAKALPLRAGYFMHWKIISWLRDNTKARWYDLGGTDGFQGLHQFKKGMAGSAGHIGRVPPVMNYASSLRARLAGDFAYFAREAVNRARMIGEKIRSDLATPDQKQK